MFRPITICLAVALSVCATAPYAESSLPNPFFVMDTCMRGIEPSTHEARVQLLYELGCAGYGGTIADVPAMGQALEAKGMKLFNFYTGVDIDTGKYDPKLESAIKALKGSDTAIWLFLKSKKFKPSDPAGDAGGVRAARKIADLAAQSGLRVALYPHINNWAERVEDAVRVVEKAGRENLGVTFNLCHFLKVDKEVNVIPALRLARPHLFFVSINGADRDGQDWNTLIQTLDSGTYDVRNALAELKRLDYTGPIGLQGFGIKGDVRENLTRSVAAWRTLSRETAESMELVNGKDFPAWREGTKGWKMAGDAFLDPDKEKALASKTGTGVAVVETKTKAAYLLSNFEHADIEAHIEFMVPEGSNSGVYFMGRYEIQVFDSYGKGEPSYPGNACGGIYQRWDKDRTPPGYEGRSPSVNASRPPGQWQDFDVVFRAPRFDASGNKTANARFVKVLHNGVLIHENQELTGPTRAAMAEHDPEKPTGPLRIQGDHGPVAYRSIRIRPIESR